MATRNKAEYFELIKEHQLEIRVEPNDEEVPSSGVFFCVFPSKAGGSWSHGDTLEGAIDACVAELKRK